MDEKKKTCGPLWHDAASTFTDMSDKEIRLFSAGHMTGLAEKVYLGACIAAMVRPSDEYRSWCLGALVRLSVIYGLEVSVFESIPDEIWFHRPEHRDRVGLIALLTPNSAEWHHHRGFLCGVPSTEIDTSFHEREGYAESHDLPLPTRWAATER